MTEKKPGRLGRSTNLSAPTTTATKAATTQNANDDDVNNDNTYKDKKFLSEINTVIDHKFESCSCWLFHDLHEEIKSLQKAEARSRSDFRNIIREELGSFFKGAY